MTRYTSILRYKIIRFRVTKIVQIIIDFTPSTEFSSLFFCIILYDFMKYIWFYESALMDFIGPFSKLGFSL